MRSTISSGGRAARQRPNTREGYAEAVSLFEHTLALAACSAILRSTDQLASALVGPVLDGMTDSAEADIARARELIEHVSASIARVRARGNWGVPEIRALFETTYFAGLRKAGMPEE
jgi:putative N-acetylmannosamine-6-phosphate epimerase